MLGGARKVAPERCHGAASAMMLDGTVLAHIETPQGLHAALRDRAEALGVTRETIDHVSGMASGYAGKLLAPVPTKALGATSLPLMLNVLGVKLLLIEDRSPEAAALLKRLPR